MSHARRLHPTLAARVGETVKFVTKRLSLFADRRARTVMCNSDV